MRSATVLALVALTGCAAPFGMVAVAEARAPDDLGCPKDQVARDPHATRGYTYRGCGKYVVYQCTWTEEATTCRPESFGVITP